METMLYKQKNPSIFKMLCIRKKNQFFFFRAYIKKIYVYSDVYISMFIFVIADISDKYDLLFKSDFFLCINSYINNIFF